MDLSQFFGHTILRIIRELRPSMRVFAWQSAVSTAVVRRFAPPQFGGMGDLKPILEDVSSKTGKTIPEAMSYVCTAPSKHIHRAYDIPLLADRKLAWRGVSGAGTSCYVRS
jgi:hypothetical protein